jgi:putative oxygen-independent coproporphyrinogen III oxidase
MPDGETAPPAGHLPAGALDGLGKRPFGLYVHVPFCAARCGYCDFNTYVPAANGDDRAAYVRAALAEIRFARRVLGDGAPAVATVFFGGGTPTLLAPDLLAALLDEIRAAFGLADGAEVTIEANPETVTVPMPGVLRDAGFTRVSLGMQSASPHVLAALDRRHTPGRAVAAAALAREAGFDHVSLDLIYGTPGETPADWEASLRAALSAGVDHLSAYGLTVEPGTRLHARVRAGAPAPRDDVLADRYRAADAVLGEAGLRWYEISNWAATDAARCRHNLGYWRSGDWWGVGPGAHSHVGGVRWWNVLRPRAYAALLAAGRSPAAGRERLSAAERRMERIMLEVRLAEGLDLGADDPRAAAAARLEARRGRLDAAALDGGRAVLTLDGRLLGDAVARALVG